MKNFAEVYNGVVIGVCACEDDHVLEAQLPMEYVEITEVTGGPVLRDLWNGTEFSRPTLSPPNYQDFVNAAQNLLDSTAHERGYDGILSLASYANSTDAKFKAEASAGIAWRDAVWSTGYAVMAQVQAGTMELPSVLGFLAMLPPIVWPS